MRVLLVLSAVLTIGLNEPVRALSIVASRPHDPAAACANVQASLDQIWAFDERSGFMSTLFYTDGHGLVEYQEYGDFIAMMRSSEGKADSQKPKLERLVLLDSDKHSPLYVAQIKRSMWHEKRWEDDGMGGQDPVSDPRFYEESSYWLINFHSNHVQRMREAFELYPVVHDERATVLDCK